MWNLIHETEAGRACAELIPQMEKEINVGLRIELEADSLLTIKDRQIRLGEEVNGVQQERIANKDSEIKTLKKENRLLKIGGVVLVVLALLI